ncbi:MAG: hypothetical protein HYY18_16975 [Planctomycetes bacterium]|nr:hypothetical protein [Planctomycetota bacterium]
MTPRLLAALAAVLFAAGCASWTPKPPPEMGEAPPEGEAEPEVADVPEGEGVAEAPPPDEKPPEPTPLVPEPPPNQEIPGWWRSAAVGGPGSAPVRRIELVFDEGGAFAGSMLMELEGKKSFVSLEGTWSKADGRLALKYADGRERSFAYSWERDVLLLADGDAEMKLVRQPALK